MVSPRVNHVCNARNAERRRLPATCTDEHVTHAPEQASLDGVRVRYDIESDLTIGAIIVAVFGAGISVGLVFGIGLLKTLGAR